MDKRYVQYGCGLEAPEGWFNYDASPTLRLQHLPIMRWLIRNRLNTNFPDNAIYGDIIKGLPEKPDSCDGLFCSHTLEHLALNDFKIALKNSYIILKPGGLFRLVLPCLEQAARTYLRSIDAGDTEASKHLLGYGIALGREKRPRKLAEIAVDIWGNSHHLWMWDELSLRKELEDAGFIKIRRCSFNDADDQMFKKVELEDRFQNALAMECSKP